MTQLVLSLFPGGGLLDHAFEQEGRAVGRHARCVELIREGMSDAEIALRLGVSEEWVRLCRQRFEG